MPTHRKSSRKGSRKSSRKGSRKRSKKGSYKGVPSTASRKTGQHTVRNLKGEKKALLPPVPKDELGHYSTKYSQAYRRDELLKAARRIGIVAAIRILNLIRNKNKNKTDVHRMMTADLEWLKAQK